MAGCHATRRRYTGTETQTRNDAFLIPGCPEATGPRETRQGKNGQRKTGNPTRLGPYESSFDINEELAGGPAVNMTVFGACPQTPRGNASDRPVRCLYKVEKGLGPGLGGASTGNRAQAKDVGESVSSRCFGWDFPA